METNYFSSAGSEIIFSEDVSIIVPTIFPLACPFTGKFTVSCDVIIPLSGSK